VPAYEKPFVLTDFPALLKLWLDCGPSLMSIVAFPSNLFVMMSDHILENSRASVNSRHDF